MNWSEIENDKRGILVGKGGKIYYSIEDHVGETYRTHAMTQPYVVFEMKLYRKVWLDNMEDMDFKISDVELDANRQCFINEVKENISKLFNEGL